MMDVHSARQRNSKRLILHSALSVGEANQIKCAHTGSCSGLMVAASALDKGSASGQAMGMSLTCQVSLGGFSGGR